LRYKHDCRVSHADGSKHDLLAWLEEHFNVVHYKIIVSLTYLLTSK